MSLDPFQTLVEIEQACKTHARPLPWQKELGRLWQGIGFLAANRYFLVPLAEVKEILTVPAVTPLSGSVEWFLGVANLRGHLLPITDLEGLMMGKPHQTTPLSRILVMDFEQTGIGFLVQQVLGVQRFIDKTLQSVSEALDLQVKPYAIGEFKQDKDWIVLSLKGLTQTTQFYHLIKETGAL